MDLKGSDPSVLSLGRFPVDGFARAVTWKRLHPRHSFITLFVCLLRRGIQYFSRIFAIVKLTPPWRVWRWACITSFLLNKASSGRWGSLTRYALCIRTVHLRSSGDWDLLIFLKPARTLAFHLCLFFQELHLLTSFFEWWFVRWLSTGVGSAVSNKAQHPRPDSDGCPQVPFLHQLIMSVFVSMVTVSTSLMIVAQLASLWSDLAS